MSHYQRRGGLDVAPPPYFCEHIDARVFYAKGRMDALEALCDRTLNTLPRRRDGDARFAPVSDIVAITFQEFRELHSPDDPSHGSMRYTYREASFWVLVRSNADGPRVLVPYMFVDNWLALAAGREVVGFPKELGAFPASWDGDPPIFDVHATAGPRGSAGRSQQILRVAPRDAANFRIDLKALPDFRRILAAMEWVADVAFGSTLRMIFLRQIRALGGGHGADLQQVTAADAAPFEMNGLLPDDVFTGYRMDLADVDSHPIRADFGFPAGPIDIPLGFRANYRFRLQPGAEVP
jgi:hypothetical protein